MSIYIIAEAGVNHNGSLELAKKLVDYAAEAGADCVKFQTFLAKNCVSAFAPKAEYQKKSTGAGESQLDMVQKLELPYDAFCILKNHCEAKGIEFLSTPFDLSSIHFLHTLGVPFWKIPSGEITNYPYLRAIGKTGRPVVMSTGMCNLEEIHAAVCVLREYGTPSIKLLHCNTEYPTPIQDVNLRAMDTLRRKFQVEVGYSDHTTGIEIPVAAAAMGATILEKHFTLDKRMDGPDHKASLDPIELKAMVEAVRKVEAAMGNGDKVASESERKNQVIARKSIVAARMIRKGELLDEETITVKRPGNGISPMRWNEVLGSTAIRDFQEDEMIEV